jgi:uncharacterized protein
MIRDRFRYRETITTILADDPTHIEAAKEGMMAARLEIERYIAADPFFAATFEPYTPKVGGRAVSRMADAALEAGVGPMAAVAGTIAWAGVEAMQNAGAVFAVIDNGGDIALLSDRPVRVGIHAGNASVSNRLAFIVPPQAEVLGICTSSATVGPSISLGSADAVTVFSRDVAAADTWATAICNEVTADEKSPIYARLPGSRVEGVLAILGDHVQSWGDLPPIVPARVDERLITAGDWL